MIESVSNTTLQGDALAVLRPQTGEQTAFWLRLALLFKPGIVITEVPYQVE